MDTTIFDFEPSIAQKLLCGIAEEIFEIRDIGKVLLVKYRTVTKWLTKNGELFDKGFTFMSKKIFQEFTLCQVEEGEVAVFFDDPQEPSLPKEYASIKDSEQKWAEWQAQQPQPLSKIPFVIPDEKPISKRFVGCDCEVRIFNSRRFEGKFQAWIVDRESGKAIVGYDNLLDFSDFTPCYEKWQELTDARLEAEKVVGNY